MSLINTINRIDRAILKIEQILVIVFGLSLTVIMITQVILRYFFHNPLFWAEEISVQFLIFLTFFGNSILTQTKKHVRVNLIEELASERAQEILDVGLNIIFLLVTLFIAYFCWLWILDPYVKNEMSGTLNIPKWYIYSALPIAFSFMCWHQVVIFINDIFPKTTKAPL